MEWKDVEVYIGGRKIEGIAECCCHFAEDDCDRAFPKLESVSLSGTVKFSGKQMREIRKFLKGYKKIRLPRKMKKRLKKENHKRFIEWCKYYLNIREHSEYLNEPIKPWTRGMSK